MTNKVEPVSVEPVAFLFTVKTGRGLREFAAIDCLEEPGEEIIKKIPLTTITAAQLEAERSRADLLLRWKGEIDSRRIALGLPFPDDYQDSPKYALDSLIEAEKQRAVTEALEPFLFDFGDFDSDEERLAEFRRIRKEARSLKGNL